jgi:hypothetical protein
MWVWQEETMRKTRELKETFKKEGVLYRKAIKDKCLDCMCGQHIDCLMPDCSLYHFRPYREAASKKRA